MQLHNVRRHRSIRTGRALEELEQEGKLVCSGIALGPAIGWMYEVWIVSNDEIIQHIYNCWSSSGNQINASLMRNQARTMPPLRTSRTSPGRMTKEPELDTSF